MEKETFLVCSVSRLRTIVQYPGERRDQHPQSGYSTIDSFPGQLILLRLKSVVSDVQHQHGICDDLTRRGRYVEDRRVLVVKIHQNVCRYY
jgi:hypothetical protein